MRTKADILAMLLEMSEDARLLAEELAENEGGIFEEWLIQHWIIDAWMNIQDVVKEWNAVYGGS